jgi:hypothetical protein
MGSALFNIGNGGPSGENSPVPDVSDPEAPKKVLLNPNASPAEIMAAWTAHQVAQGISPDEALTEIFKSKR